MSEPCPLVDLELSGPSWPLMFSYLGSITERYGMTMYARAPEKSSSDGVRLSVGVPRAETKLQAEEVVAALLEQIRIATIQVQSSVVTLI